MSLPKKVWASCRAANRRKIRGAGEACLDIGEVTKPRRECLALIVDVDLAVLRKYQRDYNGVIDVSESIVKRTPTLSSATPCLPTAYYCEHRWDDWRATASLLSQKIEDESQSAKRARSCSPRRLLFGPWDKSPAAKRAPARRHQAGRGTGHRPCGADEDNLA